MRWTTAQRVSKILRDELGDPPEGGQGLELWFARIADYVRDNPDPLPVFGKEYLIDNGHGGSSIGAYVGPVPGLDKDAEVWVFRIPAIGGDSDYEEHGRATILDDYEAWKNDQMSDVDPAEGDTIRLGEGGDTL